MNKGKLLIKCAARAVIVGLKQIPIVGGSIEWIDDCIDIAQSLKSYKTSIILKIA
ncbi:MAG: hypothetical protein K8S87_04320 [Planctomycetes bacterium]|nr:hypothetical protein [Planctomycetota bacterium]